MPSVSILRELRDELVRLAATVVKANARVDVVGSQLRASSGSAWLHANRLWVTNDHVVRGARGKVTLTIGHQEIDGEVVGKDSDTDLAVIRTSEEIATPPLRLRVRPPDLGELCFAVGAPLGEFADTFSMGIVSGLNRQLRCEGGKVIEDVLQTDAAINHGNSGGPLVDVEGAVLGVNAAGIDDASNIGFAIPSSTVADIVPELIEAGVIQRATLGVKLEIRKSACASGDDLVVLGAVNDRSPFRPGDILREVNGRPVNRRADLMRVLRRDVINREIALMVERDGKSHILSLRPQLRQA